MALQDAQTAVEGALEPLDIGLNAPRLTAPEACGAAYTETDRADVVKVIGWLNQSAKTQSWLAGIARVNASTLNQIIKGEYPSPPAKHLGKVLEAIASHTERVGTRGVPFVETTVYRLAVSVFHRARSYQNLGVLTGSVGTGKTRAADEYERRTPNVYVVACIRNMSASAFMDGVLEKLSLSNEARGASKERKFLLIVRTLKGSESLLIVDEAETVSDETLHYIRRIRDLAKVGIVLMGTDELMGKIKPENGRFDQIRSRVGYWPETVAAITRQDADEIALAAFAEHEPDSKTLDALWQVGGGSMRLLVEALIPAIRDYGLRNNRALDAALVRQVATEVLRMTVAAPKTSKTGASA